MYVHVHESLLGHVHLGRKFHAHTEILACACVLVRVAFSEVHENRFIGARVQVHVRPRGNTRDIYDECGEPIQAVDHHVALRRTADGKYASLYARSLIVGEV